MGFVIVSVLPIRVFVEMEVHVVKSGEFWMI